MKNRCSVFRPPSFCRFILIALLLTLLSSLQAAGQPATANPDQSVGIDPDDGTPGSGRSAPPHLIPNPDSTADYARATRTCSGVPSIAVSRGGRLWAAWYSGKTPGEIIERCPHSYTVLSTSGDGGKTWKEVLAIDPDGSGPLKAYDPRPWIAPDGTLWVIWHHTSVREAWAITANDAERENPVWSQPRRIARGIILNRPIVLADGEWMFSVSDRKTGDTFGMQSLVSRDKGETFAVKGELVLDYDLAPSEPMTVERQDGSLWMLLRTKLGIGESFSTDGGLSWSPLRVPAIQHTASRFYLGRLQSGNLLLVKHMGIDVDPTSAGRQQRRELTAFISKDDGKTWSSGLVIDERNPVSYPDAQQAADGTIHLIWDYSRSKEQEILTTTFREEDVLAANEAASARVKANRRLVSKGGTPE
jgi:hypothetical protein